MVACGSDSPSETICQNRSASLAFAVAPAPNALQSAFDAAAAEFSVPAELLSAISYVETRWQMVEGHEEHGQPAAYGVMALRGERLATGAQLAGLHADQARTDATANIRAAAALLKNIADELGVRAATPAEWAPVLERFSGLVGAGPAAYAQQVIDRATLRPVFLNAVPECGPTVKPPPAPPAGPDFAGSLWRPSPNFNARMSGKGGVPHMLIIHTCEGAYVGCWSWLTNTVSQVSAHYVVNEDGSEVSQLVTDANRAWHIGATYDCALNRKHDCDLTGVQSNHFTIGIEHGGFAAQTTFPEGQLETSARLACAITKAHAIPRDWQHIVAHGQLQPYNRTDPGRNWPWVNYVTRIQRVCAETVVDDDRNWNDLTLAAPVAPAAWSFAETDAGYYGGGYRLAATAESASDPFVFRFYLATAGNKTIDARWVPGANRTAAATYEIGSATVVVDQRTGGDWKELGTFSFAAGWNEVKLLRRGALGAVVIADAIRVR